MKPVVGLGQSCMPSDDDKFIARPQKKFSFPFAKECEFCPFLQQWWCSH